MSDDRHIVKLVVGVNGEPITVDMMDGSIKLDNHGIILSRRAVTDIFVGLKRMYGNDMLKSIYFVDSPDEEFMEYMRQWFELTGLISVPIVGSIRKLRATWTVEDILGQPEDTGLWISEQQPPDDGPRYFEDTEPQGGA